MGKEMGKGEIESFEVKGYDNDDYLVKSTSMLAFLTFFSLVVDVIFSSVWGPEMLEFGNGATKCSFVVFIVSMFIKTVLLFYSAQIILKDSEPSNNRRTVVTDEVKENTNDAIDNTHPHSILRNGGHTNSKNEVRGKPQGVLFDLDPTKSEEPYGNNSSSVKHFRSLSSTDDIRERQYSSPLYRMADDNTSPPAFSPGIPGLVSPAVFVLPKNEIQPPPPLGSPAVVSKNEIPPPPPLQSVQTPMPPPPPPPPTSY